MAVTFDVRAPDGIMFALEDVRTVYAGGGTIYNGVYEVTPRAAEAVILPTKDRQMRADVTVRSVPYFEVANDKGDTVYIAAEV